MEAEIRLPVIDRFAFQVAVHLLEKRRGSDIQNGNRWIVAIGIIRVPIEIRSQLLQSRQIHLVLELVRVAALYGRHRRTRQLRLHFHHQVGVGLRGSRAVAEQFENILHVLNVAFTRLFRFRVVLRVVVAIGQAEAALVERRDHLLRIVGILIGASREKQRARSERRMEIREQRREIMRCLERGDAVEIGLDRIDTVLLGGGFVDACGVEVADLLSNSIALTARRRGLLQNPVQKIQVVFVQFAVDAPRRLIGRDRIVLLPAPARILVQVHARIDRLVDRFEIQTWRIGKRRLAGRLRPSRCAERKSQRRDAQHSSELHKHLRGK